MEEKRQKEQEENVIQNTGNEEVIEHVETEDALDNETEQNDVETDQDLSAEVEKLTEQVKTLLEEKENLNERLLRVQAEYDNFRKRTEKERVAARKYQAQDLATELLPVIDNFERALQTEVTEENKSFHDGVKMVYDQFLQALNTQGVEVMEVIDQPFDPNLHHAVMQVEEADKEPNTVVEELQKGFLLKDKVIRPAMVKVNK